MDICNDPSYTCGDKRSAVTGTSSSTGINTGVDRSIELTVGEATVTMQTRKRTYDYTDSRVVVISGFRWIVYNNEFSPCYTASSTFESTFSEDYATLDTEILFLDLRYDIVVTKETKESLKLTDADNKAESDSVSVFTGYDSTFLHPYVFETAPISRDITFNLLIGSEKTELHTEHIDAGYPDDINLLMPSAPEQGANGWKINGPAWAIPFPWYIQPNHKESDGNQWLFWPPWLRAIGTVNDAQDKINRDLVYEFRNGGGRSGIAGSPQLIVADFFKGSVATDADGNRFYSMAIPSNSQLVNPEYKFPIKLIVDGVEVEIPTEQVRDRVMEGTPPVQKKDSKGELVWTDAKDSEHNVWYPIAPL